VNERRKRKVKWRGTGKCGERRGVKGEDCPLRWWTGYA